MFSRPDIFISRKIYATSGAFMIVVRCFGLFPMNIREEGEGYILKWSFPYAVYSFILGLALIGGTYEGYVGDILIGLDKSIRMKTRTDMLVTFVDLTAVLTILFCGVFITPNKYSAFQKLIKCFNKVDSIVPQKNLKSTRNLAAFMITFFVFGISLAILADTIVYFVLFAKRNGLLFVFKSYAVYYVSYHVAYASLFTLWHLLFSLYRRVRALSEELQSLSKPTNQLKLTSEYVEDLTTAYGNICDASKATNELIGKNILVVIATVLFHLVLTLYFMIMSLYRDRKPIVYNFLQIAWVFVHFSRLITVVYPCHICQLGVENVKASICKMEINETDYQIKKKLKNFSTVLHLRKLEITSRRLAVVDASLVTSIVSATTTYLMLLIQVGVNDKNT